MSHGVKKETYVDADEKTARALTYDMMDAIFHKIDEIKECYSDHKVICNSRFGKMEKRKKIDTGVAVASGFGGGFVAVLIKKIFF